MPRTKNDIVEIYRTLKAKAGGVPLRYREFLRKSEIPRREFEKLFGASPYSKLQKMAGDAPNRLDLQATSLHDIMSTYGDLACDVLAAEGRFPVATDWLQKDLRPTESGLKKVHGIGWNDFAQKFAAFLSAPF